MVEYLEKRIYSEKVLKDNIDKYKEYFIKFYGESERKRIEEAFSKILLIPYVRPSEAGMLLTQLQNEITNSILEKYSKKLKPYELEGIGDFSCLEGFSLYEYTQLVEELKKEEKDGKKINELFRKTKRLLEKIDKGITPSNLSTFSDNPIYQELEYLSEKFPSMQQEFNEMYSKFEWYKILVYKGWKMNAAIERKWYTKFIRSNLENLPEGIKKEAEEYLTSDEKEIPASIRKIFGSGMYDSSTSNDSEEKAKQQKIDESREECTKAWKLEEQKNHFICTYYQEKLDNLGLFHPVKLEEEMLADLTACLPNVRKVNGKYDIFCPILICLESKEKGKIDHNIIHELNHLLELTLSEVNDNGYEIQSGWDTIKYSKTESEDESKDESKGNSSREFELFSEAINELIAQDICKEMNNDGFFLFDQEKTRYNESGYESTLYLVRDFYEKYKDKILESRKTGNIDIICDTVGKENFLELNGLFAVHYDEETDKMKTYLPPETMQKQRKARNDILKNMEEYSKESGLGEANVGKTR